MRAERIQNLGSPADVLRAVGDGARRGGLPPPAALIGEWFGSKAVIAPTLAADPIDPAAVFDVAPGGRTDAVGGGWMGYLSYPHPGSDGTPPRIPEAAGGWTDCVLRLDSDNVWWYETLTGARLPDWITAALKAETGHGSCEVTWQPPDSAEHRRGVLSCLEAIGAGEVYQACVCTRFTGNASGSTLDFFADAVARTTPARAAYLAGDWGAVVSLSPELFLRRVGEDVSSSPIKGTLPVQADPELLRASAKDVAENVMIVDLVRNDLGRVARTGSVTIPELLAVRPAPGCGIWCRRCRPKCHWTFRMPIYWPRPSRPPRSPERRKAVRANCSHSGNHTGAASTAVPSGWLHR